MTTRLRMLIKYPSAPERWRFMEASLSELQQIRTEIVEASDKYMEGYDTETIVVDMAIAKAEQGESIYVARHGDKATNSDACILLRYWQQGRR